MTVVADRRRWALPLLLAERARDLGDRPLVSFGIGEHTLTYGDAARLSGRVAANLADAGIGKGDSVLLMLRNRLEFVLAWFGLSKIGAVQVPVNVDYQGTFLEHVANQSLARVAIADADLYPAIARSAPALANLERVYLVGGIDSEPDGAGFRIGAFEDLLGAGEPPTVMTLPSDVAAIYFTSGTTGRAKGALVTYAQSHLLAERHQELMRMGEGDIYISQLPLFHINAQVLGVYNAILVGASARLEAHFSASSWLDQLRQARATHTGLLGVMLAFLLKQPERADDAGSGLQCAWTVPCPAPQARAFKARYGVGRVVSSYGTTEVGMVTSQDDDDVHLGASGTLGKDWYEAMVVDPETDEPLPAGSEGEIVVRGRFPWTISPGYVGSPEDTVRTMRNLWFHTGDCVRQDEDGRFWYVDRIRDCIRRRGENIASIDVEAVLTGHPAIADAAVVAVASEEPGGEDEMLACIEPVAGASIGPDDIWSWCDQRLPHFAVPRHLEIGGELPRTPTGKVTKYVLRQRGLTDRCVDRGTSRSRTRRKLPG